MFDLDFAFVIELLNCCWLIFSDFAYPTVKDRMPVILTKVIDELYRMKTIVKESHGEVSTAMYLLDIGHIIGVALLRMYVE